MPEAAELPSPNSVCSVKPWVLDTILQLPETSEWSGKPYTPFKLVDVASTSAEFAQVKAHFQKSVHAPTTVLKIQRVENPFLLTAFLMKKRKMGSSVLELHLFHGTNRTHIEGICKDNFNWRLRGSSRGYTFGQGTSFAHNAYFATHYTQGSNTVIYARVLVRRSIIGNLTTVVPPEPFDTTQNAPGTVLVKYEDDDCYPDYVIHYGTAAVEQQGPVVFMIIPNKSLAEIFRLMAMK